MNSCDQFGIPDYLHRNGRSEDNIFDKDEMLYRRFSKLESPDGKSLSAAMLQTREMSVNREKYSKSPSDVLYSTTSKDHYFSHGVISMGYGQIFCLSVKHPDDKNIKYTFSVVHSPEECMFPHALIIVMNNGSPVKKIKPSKIRNLIKDEVLKQASLVKPAS